MARYVILRVLWLIPVLFAVSLITFTLMHLVPGGPWDADKQLPPSVVENLNRRYGLDKPVWQQYLDFAGKAVRGDLGVSYLYQDREIRDILRQGFPITATLGAAALVVTFLVGLPLGIVAALRQNTWIDYLCVFFATMGAAAPSFITGIVLVLIFSVVLHLLPTGGWGTPEKVILPALALGLYPAAYVARITRSSMLEELHQDYVRTAHGKGLANRTVILRHVLKNALIPVLTISGPLAAFFATGSFIIESLFSIPGIGRAYVQAVFARDYGLIMGTTLFYAVIVVVANLVVDVMYGVVDPRIRYQ